MKKDIVYFNTANTTMPYNQHLSDRIEAYLQQKKVPNEPKMMMGGLAYMVDNKMCVGIIKDSLMVRIAPEDYDAALLKPGCRQMDFTGRVLKGFVMVDPEGIDMDKDLAYWIDLALEFNPRARSSKSKKKK